LFHFVDGKPPGFKIQIFERKSQWIEKYRVQEILKAYIFFFCFQNFVFATLGKLVTPKFVSFSTIRSLAKGIESNS
jgi:hypothetical protein